MHGKRPLCWFGLVPWAVLAFAGPPARRPVSDAQIVFQFLTVVHEDGSAEFETILRFTPAGIDEFLKKNDAAEDAICAEATKQIVNSFGAFTQVHHGEDIWCTYAITLDNLPELRNHLEDEYAVNVRALEITDATFALDLSWTRFPCTTSDSVKFGCEWSVEAPGKVGDNNATRVIGRTLTWDLTANGTPKRFTAESKVGGSDSTLPILVFILMCGCCTVILLMGAGIGVFYFLRKRNRPSADAKPSAPAAPAFSPSPADTIKLQ
jgi:hypothetical protein